MWVTLIMMLISYFMSAKSGNSKGKSAAIAATVGLGTYWASQNVGTVADANTAIDEFFTPNATGSTADTVNEGLARTAVTAGAAATASTGTIASLGNSAADVLKSWGPAGTVGVVAGTAAATSSDWDKWLPWIAGGAAFFILAKD